jgi:hypothetical protein
MAMVTDKAITSLPSTANIDRVKPLLHTLRQSRQLTRFVLVWFAIGAGCDHGFTAGVAQVHRLGVFQRRRHETRGQR